MAKDKNQKIAQKILSHPDKETIIAKLIANVSISDIKEWLSSAYTNPEEEIFILSEKTISLFKDDYLDFYNIVKEDLSKNNKQPILYSEELQKELDGNLTYKKTLEEVANNELDIKMIAKNLAAAIQARATQVFDIIQEDPRNVKMDRVLVEWLNLLLLTIEKFDQIQAGNINQTNVHNNINITIVDDHINMIYNLIRNILSEIDYDASLLFIERFSEEISKLKLQQPEILPQEERLSEIKLLDNTITNKLKS